MNMVRVLVAGFLLGMTCPIHAQEQDRYPVRQLTSSIDQEGFPTWSPDGTAIAFTSARTGKMDIYVMDVDLEDVHAAIRALNE